MPHNVSELVESVMLFLIKSNLQTVYLLTVKEKLYIIKNSSELLCHGTIAITIPFSSDVYILLFVVNVTTWWSMY